MAITEDGLKLVLAVASRGEIFDEVRKAAFEAKGGTDSVFDNNPQDKKLVDGVAVIDIAGPLFKHATLLTKVSDAGSYEGIRADLDKAVNNFSCKAILLNINSPGGEVHGCGELADAIFAARGEKPIVAYASGDCCSAAYWLASAADKIVVAPTAIVGSIGVRSMMVDGSKADELKGVKEYNIVSDQSPYKVSDPANAKDRDRAVGKLTDIAAVFIGAVARYRGVNTDVVAKEYGKGDVFIGQKSIDAGLADEVGDFDSILASLIQTRGAYQMANKTAASIDSGKCDGCNRIMDDDDEAFCLACHGAEASASASFSKEIFAIAGTTDISRALGALTAMKAQAELAEKLQGELAVLAAKSEKAEIKSLLDEAVKDGQIKHAKRADAEAQAAKYGVEGLKGWLSIMPKAATPAEPPDEDEEDKKKEKEPTPTANKEIRQILAATGVSPADFAKHAAKYRAILNPVEEE